MTWSWFLKENNGVVGRTVKHAPHSDSPNTGGRLRRKRPISILPSSSSQAGFIVGFSGAGLPSRTVRSRLQTAAAGLDVIETPGAGDGPECRLNWFNRRLRLQHTTRSMITFLLQDVHLYQQHLLWICVLHRMAWWVRSEKLYRCLWWCLPCH